MFVIYLEINTIFIMNFYVYKFPNERLDFFIHRKTTTSIHVFLLLVRTRSLIANQHMLLCRLESDIHSSQALSNVLIHLEELKKSNMDVRSL